MSVPVREALFVSYDAWLHFHRRMRSIAREWNGSRAHTEDDPVEALRIAALVRGTEYDDLRREMRELHARGFAGRYLIAV